MQPDRAAADGGVAEQQQHAGRGVQRGVDRREELRAAALVQQRRDLVAAAAAGPPRKSGGDSPSDKSGDAVEVAADDAVPVYDRQDACRD